MFKNFTVYLEDCCSLASSSRTIKTLILFGQHEANHCKGTNIRHIFYNIDNSINVSSQNVLWPISRGKNYRLEAQQLREMFARANAQKQLEGNPIVQTNDAVSI